MRLERSVVMLVLLALAGCGEEEGTNVLPRYERTCSAGETCPGRKCIQVGSNEQGVSGVCSRTCSADADCGPGAACFLLGEAGPSCLSLCSEEAPCEGGLVCEVVGSGGETACFVEPAAQNP